MASNKRMHAIENAAHFQRMILDVMNERRSDDKILWCYVQLGVCGLVLN